MSFDEYYINNRRDCGRGAFRRDGCNDGCYDTVYDLDRSINFTPRRRDGLSDNGLFDLPLNCFSFPALKCNRRCGCGNNGSCCGRADYSGSNRMNAYGDGCRPTGLDGRGLDGFFERSSVNPCGGCNGFFDYRRNGFFDDGQNGACTRNGSASVIPYAAAAPSNVTAHRSGLSHIAASLAFPGSKSVDITNGTIAPPQDLPFFFTAPHDGVILSVEGSFTSESPIYLPNDTKTIPYLVVAVSGRSENQFRIVNDSKAFPETPLIGGTTYAAFLTRELRRDGLCIRIKKGDRIALMGAIETADSDVAISLELNFSGGVLL